MTRSMRLLAVLAILATVCAVVTADEPTLFKPDEDVVAQMEVSSIEQRLKAKQEEADRYEAYLQAQNKAIQSQGPITQYRNGQAVQHEAVEVVSSGGGGRRIVGTTPVVEMKGSDGKFHYVPQAPAMPPARTDDPPLANSDEGERYTPKQRVAAHHQPNPVVPKPALRGKPMLGANSEHRATDAAPSVYSTVDSSAEYQQPEMGESTGIGMDLPVPRFISDLLPRAAAPVDEGMEPPLAVLREPTRRYAEPHRGAKPAAAKKKPVAAAAAVKRAAVKHAAVRPARVARNAAAPPQGYMGAPPTHLNGGLSFGGRVQASQGAFDESGLWPAPLAPGPAPVEARSKMLQVHSRVVRRRPSVTKAAARPVAAAIPDSLSTVVTAEQAVPMEKEAESNVLIREKRLYAVRALKDYLDTVKAVRAVAPLLHRRNTRMVLPRFPSMTEELSQSNSRDDGDVPAEEGNPGDLCTNGSGQSPINLQPQSTRLAPFKGRVDFNYRHVENLNLHHMKYNVAVGFEDESPGTLSYAGVQYALKSCSFFSPSAHTIEGFHYEMEMQCTHVGREHGKLVYAVTAFMIKAEDTLPPNKYFSDVLLEFSTQPGDIKVKSLFDMRGLIDSLKADPSFFHYVGSLSAPPCVEGVQYFVFKQPLFTTIVDRDIILKSVGPNNRPTQPLNGRHVEVWDASAVPSSTAEPRQPQQQAGESMRDEMAQIVQMRMMAEQQAKRMTAAAAAAGEKTAPLPQQAQQAPVAQPASSEGTSARNERGLNVSTAMPLAAAATVNTESQAQEVEASPEVQLPAADAGGGDM